ncbi:hypothetical protein B0H19DRAFT_203264 [Mycena capillaripes]|nr:hypothetical protein B0H19DRAFT_203264 [Mycena capillaripes]
MPFETYNYPLEIVQDYVDASVLNGLATLGGFWTFVNGAFAMVFGANLLYFLFRRRSLSALGIVHLFQRRKLIRNWNEDFPALYTEGGQPGSEPAGIVAFLRERLVDLDDEDKDLDDDEDGHPGDLEAQRPSLQSMHRPIASEDDVDAPTNEAPQELRPDTFELKTLLSSTGRNLTPEVPCLRDTSVRNAVGPHEIRAIVPEDVSI